MISELYACLYAREFSAQALLRPKPELREQPCAVMEGEPPFERVCSLNTKARLLGIEHGMTRVELDTFPASVVLARSISSERATKAVMLECAAAFSPRIEDRSTDTALILGLDIAGTERLFGLSEVLARKLLEQVRSVGVSARVLVSSNFDAAICLARGISSGKQVHVIAQADEANALASLPVSVLDLTEDQADTFAAWGIRTLGMLAALPERELIARMGQDGKRLRQLARGENQHLFQPVAPVFTLEEHIDLDTPIELLDSLLFVVSTMLDQLIVRAKARVLALASVTITLSLEGGASHSRTVRPALPTTDKQFILKLLHLDLEAHPPDKAIIGVALHAEAGGQSKVQTGLFSPPLPEPTRLDVTLARIRKVVGEKNVGRPVLEDTHAPDSFRVEPFDLSSDKPVTPIPSQQRAVLRMLRPPEAVAVTLKDSRPVVFRFRNEQFTVERAYGPWVADGGWWTGEQWIYKQWDIVAHTQNESLLCCCMMHDFMHNQWQTVALYD
jgi:protein ImuB